MTPFGHSFLPGPTDVRPEIMQAMLEPMYFHRSPRLVSMLHEMQPVLRQMFGTAEPVFIETCSASGFMEAAIRNGVPHRVLVVVGGYFGEQFASVAEGCGKEVIRVHVPPGATIEPDQLEQFLDGPPVDAVALVHSESSTGALAPLADLAAVVHRHPGVLLLVDAVTSVGAVPFEADAWGVDFAFTGSQKALAIPPGLAVGMASSRFVERALTLPNRGWYWSIPDLVRIAETGALLHTPCLPLYHALAAQMRDIAVAGGMPPRWARHAEMLRLVEAWVETTPGTRLVAGAGRRSPAVSAIELPSSHSPPAVMAALAARGWTIARGLEPLADRVIRIGHMGDLTPDHLGGLLAALSDVLREGSP